MDGSGRRVIRDGHCQADTGNITVRRKLAAKVMIRELVESKMRAGMGPEDLIRDAGLSNEMVLLINMYAFSGGSASVGEIARELGMNARTAAYRMKTALEKLNGKQDMRRENRRGCGRISAIIKERMARGEGLEGIIASSRLNETQKRILHGYVLADSPKTFAETAKELGLSLVGVTAALRSMEYRLGGPESGPKRLREYAAMSDEELEREIRERGACTRTQVWKNDHVLGMVAKERGLMDHMFPNAPEVLLREAVHGLPAAGADISQPISGLGELERAAVCELALVDPYGTIKGFAKAHGISTYEAKKAVNRAISGLTPKRTTCRTANGLRERLLSWDGLEEFRESLSGTQKMLFERRILHEGLSNPATMQEIGDEAGVSKQRIGQIEAVLVRKAEAALNGECALEWGGKRMKLIRKAALGILERRGWDGLVRELGLTSREEKALTQYIMQPNKTTVEKSAARAGLEPKDIRNSIFSLYRKCGAFVSRNKKQTDKIQ